MEPTSRHSRFGPRCSGWLQRTLPRAEGSLSVLLTSRTLLSEASWFDCEVFD